MPADRNCYKFFIFRDQDGLRMKMVVDELYYKATGHLIAEIRASWPDLSFDVAVKYPAEWDWRDAGYLADLYARPAAMMIEARGGKGEPLRFKN